MLLLPAVPPLFFRLMAMLNKVAPLAKKEVPAMTARMEALIDALPVSVGASNREGDEVGDSSTVSLLSNPTKKDS